MGVLALAVIRTARVTDFEALAALARPEWHETLRHAIEGGGCAVSEAKGRIAGYVALDHTFYANGFVSLLFVREEERRRGIGEALLRHAIASCRTPKLFTSTNLSNAPMQRLLAKLGFALCGVVHELDPGDPELVYVRRGRTG